MRILTLAAAMFLATALHSATPPSVAGLWSWHSRWTSAPAEIVKDSGPQWYASGLLLNLCEDGRMRMATGVLYRGTGSAILGSSDGLSLYEGTWRLESESVVARYRLVDSEIPFTGMDVAMRTEVEEHLRIEDGELLFAFRYPREVASRNLRLTSSAVATQSVEDRFVKCGADKTAAPSSKSLERTRGR